MRRHGQPHLIPTTGNPAPLTRVDLTHEFIKESWLQKTLHNNPEILPVSELDSYFAPPVSIGREILNIDNLFVSPAGGITLVETKLWRNPEAMRTVVAQILDYAKRLSKLSYEDLEKEAKSALKATQQGKFSLYAHVTAGLTDDVPDEQEFHDAVQKNLRHTKFMLLIVGDGIRETVESMVDLFQQYPQMRFTFGLVELQVFESSTFTGKLIIPHVIARTTEIERAVVRIEGNATATVSFDLNEEGKVGGYKSHTLTEQEFFDALKDDTTRKVFHRLLTVSLELGAYHAWAVASVSIRFRDPKGTENHLRILRLRKDGSVALRSFPKQFQELGIDPNIGSQWLEEASSLFDNVSVNKEKQTLSREFTAKEVDDKYDEFEEIFRKTADKITTSLGTMKSDE